MGNLWCRSTRPSSIRPTLEQARAITGMVKAEENTLRILQYNVLAESYAPNAWLPHVPPHILSWKARSWAVLRHIAAFDADVVCLQEIDHYADFFQPEMTALGYTGLYKRRSGGKPDGCAIFWKSKKFMRRSAFSLEYNDLVRKYNNQDFSTNNVACGVLLAPAGAALASHMERAAPEASSLKLPHHFWVACTHFYWDPKLAHVKLAQAVALKQKIQEQTVQAPAPVIVCGDLNSTPKSLVYEYLTAPSLQVAAEVRSRCLPELQKAVIAAKSSAESPATPLPTAENKEAEGTAESLFPESPEPILRSVRQGAEPEVTNYTPDFRDTLDYVMVSLDAFAIRQHNTLPGMADLKDHAGLPSADWPSDHLALCCDLVMTKFDNQS